MTKNLDSTIEFMRSDDYKDRFIAEYWQTKIRRDKLEKMLIKIEAGTMTIPGNSSVELLTQQKLYMDAYLHALAVRAELEVIDLGKFNL